MIYLDNAATSFYKPQAVKDAVNHALGTLTANPGRSSHTPSIEIATKIYETRVKVRDFFHADSEERVVFTPNCTTALNYAIFGSVVDGGHVITTVYEHNSVLRPLFALARQRRITLTLLYPDQHGKIDPHDVERNIRKNTYLVIVNHISNVVGAQQDIASIGEICHKHGVLFMVDGAQSAGHTRIDMHRDHIDILCFAGHKGLYAITGSGGLVCQNNVSLTPIILGGTGTFSSDVTQPRTFPEGYESGTVPSIPIVSLNAGLDYVMANFDNILAKEHILSQYLIKKLSDLPISRYFYDDSVGVVSFNIGDIGSSTVGDMLNEDYGICVRTGLHCAPKIHQYLGTLEQGTVRVSVSADNTLADIDALHDAIFEISQKFGL